MNTSVSKCVKEALTTKLIIRIQKRRIKILNEILAIHIIKYISTPYDNTGIDSTSGLRGFIAEGIRGYDTTAR